MTQETKLKCKHCGLEIKCFAETPDLYEHYAHVPSDLVTCFIANYDSLSPYDELWDKYHRYDGTPMIAEPEVVKQ